MSTTIKNPLIKEDFLCLLRGQELNLVCEIMQPVILLLLGVSDYIIIL